MAAVALALGLVVGTILAFAVLGGVGFVFGRSRPLAPEDFKGLSDEWLQELQADAQVSTKT